MKTRFLLMFVVCLLSLALIPDSKAEREIFTMDELSKRSDAIVIGTIESTWIDIRLSDDHPIVDTAKIKVDDWIKNDKNSDTLEIRYYGYWAKTIDDLRGKFIWDNPLFSYESGQKVLLILDHEEHTGVMGEGYYPLFEGSFVIHDDVATSLAAEQIELTLLKKTIYNNLKNKSSEPKVTDSLKIPNAERDAKLSAGYKLYPGVGWVHPDDLGNQQPIYRNNPDNPGELILDIDAMIKEYYELDSKGCLQFCSKKVANNVFSFCGGSGFYSEGYMFTNNSTHYFDHNECEWIESDNSLNTLLGKTLDEWSKYTYDELRQISETDKDFNQELGRLAIKEHMQEQLALNNITNSHDDFKVFSGYSESYSVGYNSVVNATDGESYLMLGFARFHIVGDYFELRKLSFDSQVYDEIQHPYYSEKPFIEISSDPNNKSQISNTNMIIHLNQTNFVTFQNNLPITIRIQEWGSNDVDEQENLNWVGPTLQSGMSGNLTFSEPGYYRWSANEPPEPFGLTWYGKGSGYITVVSDSVDELSFTTKNKMAGSFVKQSDIPWGGLGVGNNQGVVVHLYPAVYDMVRDTRDYYTQHLEELIPFDVPLILVEPKNYDYGQNYENED